MLLIVPCLRNRPTETQPGGFFSFYLVKIEPPRHLLKCLILPGQFVTSSLRRLHSQHISFVNFRKWQNSNPTERVNMMENMLTYYFLKHLSGPEP